MATSRQNIFPLIALVFAICVSMLIIPVHLYATTSALDSHCEVVFNFANSSSTKQKIDIEEIHDSCMKKTFENDQDENLSKANMDCFYKCFYQKIGFFFKNGTYDPHAVQDLYENFSNASSVYISNVANFYQNCADTSKARIQDLEKNGTSTTECSFYGEFEHCMGIELLVAVVDLDIPVENGTSINICGVETSSGRNLSLSYLRN